MSQLRNLSFVAALVLVSFSCTCACAAKPTTGQEIWVLEQTLHGMGNRSVYVSDCALKVAYPEAGWSLVSIGPKWDVTMYNTASKTCCQLSREKYLRSIAGRAALISGMLKSGKGKWQKTATSSTMFGLKTLLYAYVKNSGTFDDGNHIKCWVTENIVVPRQALDISFGLMGTPDTTNMLPLRMLSSDPTGRTTFALDTQRVKRERVSVDPFRVPTGYRRVANESEVVLGEDGNSVIKDFAHITGP